MTCQVSVSSPNGLLTKALLNSTSSISFISERLAKCLQPLSLNTARISGIAGLSHGSSHSVTNFVVRPWNSPTKQYVVSVIIVPQVTCDLPIHPVTLDPGWSQDSNSRIHPLVVPALLISFSESICLSKRCFKAGGLVLQDVPWRSKQNSDGYLLGPLTGVLPPLSLSSTMSPCCLVTTCCVNSGKWRKLPLRVQSYPPRSTSLYVPKEVRRRLMQLHGFTNALESAFAAVVYLCVVDLEEVVHTSLVISKTRVAPQETNNSSPRAVWSTFAGSDPLPRQASA